MEGFVILSARPLVMFLTVLVKFLFMCTGVGSKSSSGNTI
jgi:hypothetical protein